MRLHLTLLSLAAPALCGVVLAQTPDFAGTGLAGSMTWRANGDPVCGLGKDFHAGRRAELRKRLEPGVVVLRGLPKVEDYLAFSQDKNFWYLTGVESPDVAFVMDVQSGKEVLLVEKPDPWRERWEGEIWDTDDQWIRDLTGVQDLRRTRHLEEVIREMLDPGEVLYTVQTPAVALAGCYDAAEPFAKERKRDKWDGRESREVALAAKLGEVFGVEVKDITKTLREMRLVKTNEEIDVLRRASEAGALAMMEGVRSTRPGLGEWDIAGVLSWMHHRNGATGPAYGAIVGSGANSLVLHYMASARRMQDGEVLLVDYGPEVDHYVTDITRTWPVNGKFSERQAELYDVVLEAQKAGIAAAKAGGTLQAVNQACAEVIQAREMGHLMAHGAVHWVGMEVHDPGPGPVTAPGAWLSSPQIRSLRGGNRHRHPSRTWCW
ncbi:MAG: Xaa-Pro peptidase family protein [Planctomycetota bacterium]